MNRAATAPSGIAPVDEDLAAQARPGHGIPSQDPNPAAQFSQEPQDEQREVESVLMGGGVVAGVATGAAIGVAVAGPVGVVVGAAVGAVAGALGGAAAGAAVKPEESAGADTTV
jgi:non-heme chloroperoxidase